MTSVQIIMKKNYCILFAFDEDSEDLAEKVQQLLNDGWVVSGSLSSSNSKLYQALIRKN
ncbi:MAG: DUF1737 domain-containing protein [Pelagibacterales bacterium]|jgi:hypothetical protein|nr:DUF1737 domain-containing protein [Pelagibacterales bacterium]|tara:strand:- start:5786 stop:5962 length:177 start_codon:yes stop_codon:yes gene_type:complete